MCGSGKTKTLCIKLQCCNHFGNGSVKRQTELLGAMNDVMLKPEKDFDRIDLLHPRSKAKGYRQLEKRELRRMSANCP